jgi:hypothetical protein
MWRSGLQDTEYFFHLQGLIAQSERAVSTGSAGSVAASTSNSSSSSSSSGSGRGKVAEARAALDAVREATWGFAYYSDKLKRNMRPYLLRPTLVYKPKDLNRDWSPRFSTLRDKNGWI